ncbi:2-amino-4-hydroxy-6-hydroxymethyldihydropteridine diphosphokinase [Snuella lapsa]|uniref:2-amino-4-hydroxy-6-hydroxymethyldihydropteridine pyrophosphokinase n=2 Tax=Snuella lapsa TaxID=870481 RepID=A0ABP6WT76_9FLAO
MHFKIGTVKAISKVYASPAFGFDGDDFLNACLVLNSDLEPEAVLHALLAIEVSLGRVRAEGVEGYQARTVDLDIIFSEEDIISTDTLEVPHPEMSKRQFVLLPLHDIVPNMVHPILHKTVSELLASCGDTSVLEPISQNLNSPRGRYNLSKYKYIAVEGNIGAGKTSLATKMANDFSATLILERFADNPFLPKFYEDMQRYAFPLEMSFLADRYQQIHEDLLQLDMFKDFIISDYDVFKSLIFSKVTLSEDEFNLYGKLFDLMHRNLIKPDLYVFLYQSTARLQANIKARGRHYEQDIANDYLEKINAGYLEFLKNQADVEVKIIDITDRDFVKNREDYLWVLGEVFG